MTNLRTDKMAFICNLTKIGTDENKAIYSIYSNVYSLRMQKSTKYLVYIVMKENLKWIKEVTYKKRLTLQNYSV